MSLPRFKRLILADAQLCMLVTNQLRRRDPVNHEVFYQLMDLLLCEYLVLCAEAGIDLRQHMQVEVYFVDAYKASLQQVINLSHLSPWFYFDNPVRKNDILRRYMNVSRPMIRQIVESLLNPSEAKSVEFIESTLSVIDQVGKSEELELAPF